MTIADMQHAVHENSKEKGFWDQSANIPEKLALIHSEISEALEEYRTHKNEDLKHIYQHKVTDPKPEGFGVELADAVIRIMDLCAYLGVDLENAIARKHSYNTTRPHLHGGKRA